MSQVRRYSKEDAARKGQEVFERDIRTKVENEDPRHFVAIDIETGDYEVGPDELGVVDRLRGRRSDAQVWTRRVGSQFAHRIGSSRTG
jgi:hypothetical protein